MSQYHWLAAPHGGEAPARANFAGWTFFENLIAYVGEPQTGLLSSAFSHFYLLFSSDFGLLRAFRTPHSVLRTTHLFRLAPRASPPTANFLLLNHMTALYRLVPLWWFPLDNAKLRRIKTNQSIGLLVFRHLPLVLAKAEALARADGLWTSPQLSITRHSNSARTQSKSFKAI